MKGKNKTYTATDFARYHAGTMSTNEMHELEKAALEDPFLGDALEGYVHAASAESDIEELHDRLAKKRKKKNVFSISSFVQNKWWRIAALFIIIAGAGYLFHRVNYVSNENSLAKNEIQTSRETKDSAILVKRDTAAKSNDLAFENQPASKLAPGEKTSLYEAKKPRIEKQVIPLATKTQPSADYKPADKSYSVSDSINPDNSSEEIKVHAVTGYVLRGKVTDESGNAVPYASITDKSRNKATVTDTAGRFLLQSKDSIVMALVTAQGYSAKAIELKKDVQPVIAMNKTKAELNSIAMASAKQRKEKKETALVLKELKQTSYGIQTTPASPESSGDHEKFDQYLKENLSPLYDENNRKLAGEVLLSFTINKKGRPKNIKVLKSFCEACEQKAIQLLEKGPDWTGKKNKQETVEIKF